MTNDRMLEALKPLLKGADRAFIRLPGTGKPNWFTMVNVLILGLTFLFALAALAEQEPVKPEPKAGNITIFNFSDIRDGDYMIDAEPSRTPKEWRLAVYAVAGYLLLSLVYWDFRGESHGRG